MTTTDIDTPQTLTSMVCSGCGFVAPVGEPRPFRCAKANGKADHVLTRHIEIGRLPDARAMFADPEPDPFIRYRRLTHTWQTAKAIGFTDGEYVDLVRQLERQIAGINGSGFTVTPLDPQPALAKAIGFDGEILVKDETGNVSGSHKGRHFMGLMLWLMIMERVDPALARARLAIASCGNAALAAAVVARAAGRGLDVFVPADASPVVVERLRELGTSVTHCPRRPHESGDPAYLRFREAVAAGALPFTCQGNENGLVIEGCQTLGWEIASQLMASRRQINRVFVQVGGGALASAVIAAFTDLHALSLLPAMPRIHAVQTESASPLRRAYDRVIARLTGDASKVEPALAALGFPGAAAHCEYDRIAEIASRVTPEEVRTVMRYAVAHRADFMWPWETVPSSVAHGILDDETYDWAAVIRGMLMSGGYPIVVSEEQLIRANRIANETTGIPVDATGSSGLAGALDLVDHGCLDSGESIAVLFTGKRRE